MKLRLVKVLGVSCMVLVVTATLFLNRPRTSDAEIPQPTSTGQSTVFQNDLDEPQLFPTAPSSFSLSDLISSIHKRSPDELLTLFLKGATSVVRDDVYVSAVILQACEAYIPPLDSHANTRHLVAMEIDGDSQIKAQRALERMKKHCEAFYRVPVAELMELKHFVKGSAYSTRSPFSGLPMSNQENLSRDELSHLKKEAESQLDLFGPISLIWLSQDLIQLGKLLSKDLEKSGDTQVAKASVILALCNLDYPCDDLTFEAENLCINIGACADSFRGAILSTVTPSQRETVLSNALEVSDLLSRHQWDTLFLRIAQM